MRKGRFVSQHFCRSCGHLGWIEAATCRSISAGPCNVTDIRRHAAELVALEPDVLRDWRQRDVGLLLQATRTVPIVFAFATDPVAPALSQLGTAGGNATGFTSSSIA